MKTIDQRVSKVLEREYKNLSKDEQQVTDSINKLISENEFALNSYIIAPRDTIGKTVLFNTPRP